jgi:hypothetical protein
MYESLNLLYHWCNLSLILLQSSILNYLQTLISCKIFTQKIDKGESETLICVHICFVQVLIKLPITLLLTVSHRLIDIFIVYRVWSEWVSDCCLTPTKQFFSYIICYPEKCLIQENVVPRKMSNTRKRSTQENV